MESWIIKKFGETCILPQLSDIEEGSDLEKECNEIFQVNAHIISTHSDVDVYRPMYETFSSPDYISLHPELKQIRLPRSYPPGHRLPENTVMPVFQWKSEYTSGSMVYAFDEPNSQLYHIVTKCEKARTPCDDAYVAIEDTLYYAGGCYRNHDFSQSYRIASGNLLFESNYMIDLDDLFATARSMAEKEVSKNLEVETYNFVTAEWEDRTNLTKLNSPKHLPIVFVFDNKIYALAGRKPFYDLRDNFKSFEYLDLDKTEKATSWTVLPPPPFLILHDSRHILWKEKKCLFVKVCDRATETCQVLLWKFDLESEKWYNHSTDPDPVSSDFLRRLTDVPADHFNGCIVNDMLFHYADVYDMHEQRLVVGYDLTTEKIVARRLEIDMNPVLGSTAQDSLACNHFIHVADDTFCILVNYMPHPVWNVSILCICLFDLKCGDNQMSLDESRACKLNELSFDVIRPRCHYFQMPSHAVVAYLTKLEGGRCQAGRN